MDRRRFLTLAASTIAVAACSARGRDAAAVASATGAPPPTAAPETTITAREFSFEAPDVLDAGLTGVTLRNAGTLPHSMSFERLKEGVTLADWQAALARGGFPAVFELAEVFGGVVQLAPGGTGWVSMELEPGTYVLLSVFQDAAGVSDASKGMVRTITVGGPARPKIAVPVADREITLRDGRAMSIDARPGAQTWKFNNAGTTVHQLVVARIASGKTGADALAWFASRQGVRPFTLVGGILGLSAGRSAWSRLDLEAGEYVAYCSLATPTSHIAAGEVTTFRIG